MLFNSASVFLLLTFLRMYIFSSLMLPLFGEERCIQHNSPPPTLWGCDGELASALIAATITSGALLRTIDFAVCSTLWMMENDIGIGSISTSGQDL